MNGFGAHQLLSDPVPPVYGPNWHLIGYFRSCVRSGIRHLLYAMVGEKMAASKSVQDKDGNEQRLQSAEIINGRKHKASCEAVCSGT